MSVACGAAMPADLVRHPVNLSYTRHMTRDSNPVLPSMMAAALRRPPTAGGGGRNALKHGHDTSEARAALLRKAAMP